HTRGCSALFYNLSHFTGWIAFNTTRCIENHNFTPLFSVSGPVWQPIVLRVSISSHGGPRTCAVSFQLAHSAVNRANHALAEIDMIKDEWNFERMRRPQSHHWRFPRENIQICWRLAQSRMSFCETN